MHEAGHTKPVLWDNLEGWGGEGGGMQFRMGETYVYLWLIHVDIWQKPSLYCKVIILWVKYIKKNLEVTFTEIMGKFLLSLETFSPKKETQGRISISVLFTYSVQSQEVPSSF